MFSLMSQAQSTMYQTYGKGDLTLFAHAFARGKKARRKAALLNRNNRLLSTDQIIDGRQIQTQTYRGLVTVPIRNIQGSEERSRDFDRAFNPIRKHNMHRWMAIARVRMRGRQLPAVDLVQIGDVFIVQDGHHRISVARAMGEEFIDANVTQWKMNQPA
jgi:hypothetical protein